VRRTPEDPRRSSTANDNTAAVRITPRSTSDADAIGDVLREVLPQLADWLSDAFARDDSWQARRHSTRWMLRDRRVVAESHDESSNRLKHRQQLDLTREARERGEQRMQAARIQQLAQTPLAIASASAGLSPTPLPRRPTTHPDLQIVVATIWSASGASSARRARHTVLLACKTRGLSGWSVIRAGRAACSIAWPARWPSAGRPSRDPCLARMD
jgi:hypothetical protein